MLISTDKLENQPTTASRAATITEVVLSSTDIEEIEVIADALQVPFRILEPISDEELWDFVDKNSEKESLRDILRTIVTARRTGGEADALIRYDVEYSTIDDDEFRGDLKLYSTDDALFKIGIETFVKPNYTFYSPALREGGLSAIIDPQTLTSAKFILDAGSGGGLLLQKLSADFNTTKLVGLDISRTAGELLVRNGFEAFVGPLSEYERQVGERPDGIFLSYFVDRDPNQKGTFDSALNLTKRGGFIVLEGLLPAETVDSQGIHYEGKNNRMVTRGISAADDVKRIVEYFIESGQGITAEKIAVGQRLVYSMDGFEKLTSVYIVFSKGE